MEFDKDLDYDLKEFKETTAKSLFNEQGEQYAGVGVSYRETETMWNLIQRLEAELSNYH